MRYIVRCTGQAYGKDGWNADGRDLAWTVDRPTTMEFNGVTALRVRLVGGSVAVLATEGTSSLEVSALEGDPLQVTFRTAC